MTWEQLDERLRGGAVLVFDSVFGPWLEKEGKTVNVNRWAAKAVMRRDLIVVKEKRSAGCYAYRSKYAPKRASVD